MKTNFEQFCKDVSWFLPPKAKIGDVKDNVTILLSDQFRNKFPLFSILATLANVSEVEVNGEPYRLYTWVNKEDEKFGWISDLVIKPKVEDSMSPEELSVGIDEILPEHLLFLENVGGIFETWNLPEDESFIILNQNFVFSLQSSYKLASQDCIYDEDEGRIFDEVDKEKQLPVESLICFSEEANGNLTFYNKKDGKVYLFLGDHSFDFVEEMEGHPEYSFYRINNVDNFVEYVELIALQMLDNIKNKK